MRKGAYVMEKNTDDRNKEQDIVQTDLRNANLSGRDLSNSDLRGVNLQGADLRWANLSNVIIDEKTNLRDAILSHADLSGAIISGTDLSGTIMREIIAKDTAFIDVVINKETDLRETDLSRALFRISNRLLVPDILTGPMTRRIIISQLLLIPVLISGWLGIGPIAIVPVALAEIAEICILIKGYLNSRTIREHAADMTRLYSYMKAANGRKISIKKLALSASLLMQWHVSDEEAVKRTVDDIRMFIRNGYISDECYDTHTHAICFPSETDTHNESLLLKADNFTPSSEMESNGPNYNAEDLINEYKRTLWHYQEAIKDEQIRRKLSVIEANVQNASNHIDVHPKDLPMFRRMTSYYFPTTVKLLKTYEGIEKQNIEGDNAKAIKKEICRMLDLFANAFAKFLDELLLSDKMDIEADVAVMETMFRQDGLCSPGIYIIGSKTGGTGRENPID